MLYKSSKYGYSLVEIIVVLTIIVLLIGIGAISYIGFSERGRDDRRILDVALIQEALGKYHSNQTGGFYPTTLDELFTNGYLDRRPTDPQTGLENAYEYTPLPAGCNNTTTFCLNYTIAVDLEKKGSQYYVQSGEIRGNIIP